MTRTSPLERSLSDAVDILRMSFTLTVNRYYVRTLNSRAIRFTCTCSPSLLWSSYYWPSDSSSSSGELLVLYLIYGVYGSCGFTFSFTLPFSLVYRFRRYRLEQELAAMSWKIRWEEMDGEESQKRERKKRKRRLEAYGQEGEALLRSASRTSVNSDKVRREGGAS